MFNKVIDHFVHAVKKYGELFKINHVFTA